MKLLICLTIMVVPLAVAEIPNNLGHLGVSVHDSMPATDDVIWSQPFDYGNLQNGLGFTSGYSWMMADDFEGNDMDLGLVEIWAIYGGGTVSEILFQVRDDSGSGPGSTVEWDHSCTDLTHTDTGYSQWGYELYYTEATIADGEEFPTVSGTVYWFVAQAQGSGPDYWLATNQMWLEMSYFSQDNGSSWTSSQDEWGTAYEQYMILSSKEALQPTTWGEIKTLL